MTKGEASMITHPFTATAREDVTLKEIEALLNERVIYRSPLVCRPLVGRGLLIEVLATAGGILGFRYVEEIPGAETALLRWEGSVQGHTLQGIDMVRTGPDGRVTELSAFLRPLPIVQLFRDEMRRRLGSRAPADIWDAGDDATPLTALFPEPA